MCLCTPPPSCNGHRSLSRSSSSPCKRTWGQHTNHVQSMSIEVLCCFGWALDIQEFSNKSVTWGDLELLSPRTIWESSGLQRSLHMDGSWKFLSSISSFTILLGNKFILIALFIGGARIAESWVHWKRKDNSVERIAGHLRKSTIKTLVPLECGSAQAFLASNEK